MREFGLEPCREALNGCTGVAVLDGVCLRHMTEEQRGPYLERAGKGEQLEARGVKVDSTLLAEIVEAMPSEHGEPRFGPLNFREATFVESVALEGKFDGPIHFIDATFGAVHHSQAS